MSRKPLRVAIVNDYEIVVAGVAAALAPFADRVKVIGRGPGIPQDEAVDVILYDTFGGTRNDVDLNPYLRRNGTKVVIFSWNTKPELVKDSLARGACGYVSKTSTAVDLVGALERVSAGELVLPAQSRTSGDAIGAWPGYEHGLSLRESDVVALVARGMSNQEIARQLFLSVNTIKTYIRTAYQKIGVTRRTQAVAWAMTHGMNPGGDLGAHGS